MPSQIHAHPYNTDFNPVTLTEADRKADFGRPGQNPSFSNLIGGTAKRQRLRNQKRKMSRIRSSKSIPGSPGTDFPVFNSIPVTQFNCLNSNSGNKRNGVRPAGFYADVETQCQVYMCFIYYTFCENRVMFIRYVHNSGLQSLNFYQNMGHHALRRNKLFKPNKHELYLFKRETDVTESEIERRLRKKRGNFEFNIMYKVFVINFIEDKEEEKKEKSNF